VPTTGGSSAVNLFSPAAAGFAWLLIVLFLSGALTTLVTTGFVFTPLNIGLAVLCFPCLFLGAWLPFRSIIIKRTGRRQSDLILRLLVFLLPSIGLIGSWLYAHRP
jgi:hypothetical protein